MRKRNIGRKGKTLSLIPLLIIIRKVSTVYKKFQLFLDTRQKIALRFQKAGSAVARKNQRGRKRRSIMVRERKKISTNVDQSKLALH